MINCESRIRVAFFSVIAPSKIGLANNQVTNPKHQLLPLGQSQPSPSRLRPGTWCLITGFGWSAHIRSVMCVKTSICPNLDTEMWLTGNVLHVEYVEL
jgi:hypothetical protein